MATLDVLTGIYSSHAIYLERVSAGFGLAVQPYLDNIEQGVSSKLNGLPARALTMEQRKSVLSEIAGIASTELQNYTSEYKANNKDLALHEGEFNAKTLSNVAFNYEASAPILSAVNKIAIGSPIKIGEGQFTTYNRYIATYWKKYADAISSTAEVGFLTGGTNREIADAILKQLPSDLRRASNAAKTMARTATNHYANAATEAFVDNNDKVLTGYRVIATLDGSTSTQCRSLDQTVWSKSDNSRPRFPLHPNCRSRYVYEVDARYRYDDSLSERSSSFVVGNEKDNKRVSSKAIYYNELSKLKAPDQDAILGPTLGKAFRKMDDPALFAKQTIDSTYNPLSIKDLKRKDNVLGNILKAQAK